MEFDEHLRLIIFEISTIGVCLNSRKRVAWLCMFFREQEQICFRNGTASTPPFCPEFSGTEPGPRSRPCAAAGAPNRGPRRHLTSSAGLEAGGRDPWGSCKFLAKFRQNVARFRLYRHQFLQENMRFAAFFKIYQILKLKFLKFDKILQILRHLQTFC